MIERHENGGVASVIAFDARPRWSARMLEMTWSRPQNPSSRRTLISRCSPSTRPDGRPLAPPASSRSPRAHGCAGTTSGDSDRRARDARLPTALRRCCRFPAGDGAHDGDAAAPDDLLIFAKRHVLAERDEVRAQQLSTTCRDDVGVCGIAVAQRGDDPSAGGRVCAKRLEDVEVVVRERGGISEQDVVADEVAAREVETCPRRWRSSTARSDLGTRGTVS